MLCLVIIHMKHLLLFLVMLIGYCAFTQVDPELLHSQNYQTIERLEIKSGSLKNNIHLSMKPLQRKDVTDYTLYIDTASNVYLTEIDYYNIEHLYRDNNDLIPEKFFEESARPLLRHFYKRPGHFFDLHNEDISLHVNPIFYGNLSVGNEVDNVGFINTRGASVRGTIDDKLSFYTILTENQVRYPDFLRAKADSLASIPTKGFYIRQQDNVFDYFEPKAGISYDATKHVNLQLGYDKHFIGDGYRSMFISENANNSLFLKFNTQFWKLNYTNIYQELQTDTDPLGPDDVNPKKYSVSHHLSFDVSDKINIGLFESIIFARPNQFEFHYLNPIIFYRAIERDLGSPDNALIGLNYSALVKDRVKLYGQILVDEFRIEDVKQWDSWANKFAFQQGIKYIDAFGVDQLDIQAEVNRVRPFTYMHRDEFTSYTHYGQAIAHPLGANFTEVVGIANYQPLRKLRLNSILTYAEYGSDRDGRSWGNDILKTYNDRVADNLKTGEGLSNKSINIQGRASYEFQHNLFIDAQGVYKRHQIENQDTRSEFFAGASVRWNFGAYDYNF